MVTKLPMTGHSREASIASGSTTTRLLGTFQGVEYVLIVGVGGGVPHYTDYNRSEKQTRNGKKNNHSNKKSQKSFLSLMFTSPKKCSFLI